MTDRGESSRRGEAPRSVRRWCEDFASRAGTYPFPLRTPAHGWPARPKRTRYVVAAPLARGSRHVRLRRVLKWEKRQPIQGFLKIFRIQYAPSGMVPATPSLQRRYRGCRAEPKRD